MAVTKPKHRRLGHSHRRGPSCPRLSCAPGGISRDRRVGRLREHGLRTPHLQGPLGLASPGGEAAVKPPGSGHAQKVSYWNRTRV